MSTSIRSTPSRRVLTTGAALAAVTLALAAPAAAHVTVSSPDATEGGYGKVVFRVPTESDTASTTKLVVTLPADTPFLYLSAQPKPGWTVSMQEGELPEPVEVDGTEVTEAVRTVTWTAEGDGIAPGEFDEFALSGGPFPDADEVVLAAEQTYDDGEVVAWDEVQEGDTEPERPAPTLTLAAAGTDGHGGGAADGDAASASADASGPDTLARVLSGAALVVALVALLGVVRENRRRA
jgi:uncharacterized protein